MHELAVCRSMLSQVARIAARHRARAVTRISVRIGPLSGVEPDLLSQAFPFAAAGTVAEHAALVIDARPVRVHCEACGHEAETGPRNLTCPRCGDGRTRLLSGDELLLAEVELLHQATDT